MSLFFLTEITIGRRRCFEFIIWTSSWQSASGEMQAPNHALFGKREKPWNLSQLSGWFVHQRSPRKSGREFQGALAHSDQRCEESLGTAIRKEEIGPNLGFHSCILLLPDFICFYHTQLVKFHPKFFSFWQNFFFLQKKRFRLSQSNKPGFHEALAKTNGERLLDSIGLLLNGFLHAESSFCHLTSKFPFSF